MTLVLLSVMKQALPALPISILLGILGYLYAVYVYESMVKSTHEYGIYL
jgi:hypothetical protein